jgi:hypothetical protein
VKLVGFAIDPGDSILVVVVPFFKSLLKKIDGILCQSVVIRLILSRFKPTATTLGAFGEVLFEATPEPVAVLTFLGV